MQKITPLFIGVGLVWLLAISLFFMLPAEASRPAAATVTSQSAVRDDSTATTTGSTGREGKNSPSDDSKDDTRQKNGSVTTENGNVKVDLPGLSVRVTGEPGSRDVSVKMPGVDLHVNEADKSRPRSDEK